MQNFPVVRFGGSNNFVNAHPDLQDKIRLTPSCEIITSPFSLKSTAATM